MESCPEGPTRLDREIRVGVPARRADGSGRRTAGRWVAPPAVAAVRFKRPSGRRTRLSRARLGKATGVPRGTDDPQGPNRPGAGGFARRPPGPGSWGLSFSGSGHPHRAPMPGSAFPARRCMRSVLRRPSRRCRPGAPAGRTTPAEGITACAISIATVIVARRCANAFMQLAGTREANRRAGRVDAPCLHDPPWGGRPGRRIWRLQPGCGRTSRRGGGPSAPVVPARPGSAAGCGLAE
jgi:hypothetical protein